MDSWQESRAVEKWSETSPVFFEEETYHPCERSGGRTISPIFLYVFKSLFSDHLSLMLGSLQRCLEVSPVQRNKKPVHYAACLLKLRRVLKNPLSNGFSQGGENALLWETDRVEHVDIMLATLPKAPGENH